MSMTLSHPDLLGRAMALAAASAVPFVHPSPALAARDGFMRLDATTLADLLRRGEVSAMELVDAAIARIEAAAPWTNRQPLVHAD